MVCRLPAPGGSALIERAAALCSFEKGANIADIGCGDGRTVKLLREKFELNASGIDCDREIISKGAADGVYGLFFADATLMPFEKESFDGALFECSFSKMEEPAKALEETFRILKKHGRIVIADFYAKGEENSFNGILGRIEKKESIETRLASAGFSVEHFEDRSGDLLTLMGQLILDGGESALYETLCVPLSVFKKIKCGYAIFIASKEGI